MQIGMMGLGRMGANMVRRLLRGGHDCVVYDINPASVAALVAAMRKQPDRFSFANSALGSMGHLATESFKREAQVDALVVSYRGTAPALTDVLSGNTALMDMNARQIALYGIHAGETGFEMINGFPCYIGHDPRHRVPLTLITEYPDETIYGDAYTAAHTAQMQTVLAAHAAWQQLASSDLLV